MAPKKSKKKKADPSMYAVKSVAPKVSAASESLLREAAQGQQQVQTEVAHDVPAGKPPARRVQAVQRVVNKLLLDGFTRTEIEAAALSALPHGLGPAFTAPAEAPQDSGFATEQAVDVALLDHLTLHAQKLPPAFASEYIVTAESHSIKFEKKEAKVQKAVEQVEEVPDAPAMVSLQDRRKMEEEKERQANIDYITRMQSQGDGDEMDSSSDEVLCEYLATTTVREVAKKKKTAKNMPRVRAEKPDIPCGTELTCLADFFAFESDELSVDARCEELVARFESEKPLLDEAKRNKDIPNMQLSGKKMKLIKTYFVTLAGCEMDKWKVAPSDGDDDDMQSLFFDDTFTAESCTTELAPLKKLPKADADAVSGLCSFLSMKGTAQKNEGTYLPKALLQKLCSVLGCSNPSYRRLGEVHSVVFAAKAAAKKVFEFSSNDVLTTTEETPASEAQQLVACVALFALVNGCTVHPRADPNAFETEANTYLFSGANVGMKLPSAHCHHFLTADYLAMWLQLINARLLTSGDDGDAFAELLATRLQGFGATKGKVSSSSSSPVSAPQRRTVMPRAQGTPLSQAEKAESEKMLATYRRTTIHASNKCYAVRQGLPAVALIEPLKAALQESDFVVVAGETGCGKTTQVPQYILDSLIEDGCGARANIICTQPRRIAAISIAERVSEERGETDPPGVGASQVGYHVRFQPMTTRNTRILYCTIGILLRKVSGGSDPLLSTVSHVVVDEVHERSCLGDFTVALLKRISRRRRELNLEPLKLVLMSATVDPKKFSDYMHGCPVLSVAGRTFPVSEHCLEDVYNMTGYELDTDGDNSLTQAKGSRGGARLNTFDEDEYEVHCETDWEANPLNPDYSAELYAAHPVSVRRNLAFLNEEKIDFDAIHAVVEYIQGRVTAGTYEEGAILVFLPGLADISKMTTLLRESGRKESRIVVPLHSSVPPEEQKLAFTPQRPGQQKIVVSTNIAETSVTVSDIVYVIDAGRAKFSAVDQNTGLASLEEGWVSKASSKQRKGRAGRVRKGICFKMYTTRRWEKMDSFETPEILRLPLTDIALQAMVLNDHVVVGSDDTDLDPTTTSTTSSLSLLHEVIDPPEQTSVDKALEDLAAVQAIDAGHAITTLGRHLAKLPVDVRIGKLLLTSSLLGVLSPVLSVAAVLSNKSPFYRDAPAEVKQKFHEDSDHLLYANVFARWEEACAGGMRAGYAFCRQYCLDWKTLESIQDTRYQLATCLADSGIVASLKGAKSLAKKTFMNKVSDMTADYNKYAHIENVVKGALCFALQPNIGVLVEGQERKGWTIDFNGISMYAHKGSVLKGREAAADPYVVFHGVLKTGAVFATDCSTIPAAVVLLFGSNLTIFHRERRAVIDGWLGVSVAAQLAVLSKMLRGRIATALAQLLDGSAEDQTQLFAPVVRFLQEN